MWGCYNKESIAKAIAITVNEVFCRPIIQTKLSPVLQKQSSIILWSTGVITEQFSVHSLVDWA